MILIENFLPNTIVKYFVFQTCNISLEIAVIIIILVKTAWIQPQCWTEALFTIHFLSFIHHIRCFCGVAIVQNWGCFHYSFFVFHLLLFLSTFTAFMVKTAIVYKLSNFSVRFAVVEVERQFLFFIYMFSDVVLEQNVTLTLSFG